MTTLIYGSSDDLIELEGDIEEEFTAIDDHNLLVFSNGVVLWVDYNDDEEWAIRALAGDPALYRIYPLDDETRSDDNYTDRAIVCDVKWAALVHPDNWVKGKGKN